MSALLKFIGETGKTTLGFLVTGLNVFAPSILVDELVASGDFVLVDNSVDNSLEEVVEPVDNSDETVDNPDGEAVQDEEPPVDNSDEEKKPVKKGGKKQ